jgi:hypothetical protein
MRNYRHLDHTSPFRQRDRLFRYRDRAFRHPDRSFRRTSEIDHLRPKQPITFRRNDRLHSNEMARHDRPKYAPKRAATPKPLASDQYLMRIEDPAIRSIMQATIAERDKLRAQVNLLKSQAVVTVDRRPLGVTVAPQSSTDPVAVLTTTAQLTVSEREALQKAIAPKFLEDQGWHEGSYGEIVNSKGRMVFDVGYARAIRRVLGKA